MKIEFEDWLEELLMLAEQRSERVAYNVQRFSFMYEDYFEQGLSPLDALEAEWG